MEVDFLEMELMNVLTLHHDNDANDDDVASATFDYIHHAHAVALPLLLEGRFPEAQRCLHLCQVACGGIAMGSVAATSEATVTDAAASSATFPASGPLDESMTAAGSPLRPSLLPPSADAASARRRAFRILRSDENRRAFSALKHRTKQLQKQLEAACRVRQVCDADSHPPKLSLGFTDDDAEETMNRREVGLSMRFVQQHLQQLPRAAPMTLTLRPAFTEGARDSNAQTSAARPPPPAARLSTPVEDRRSGSAPLRLPSLVISRPPGSDRHQVASTAPAACHRGALPPPPLPERGIAIGGQSYLDQRKVRKGLPLLVTPGRTLCESRSPLRAVSGGAEHRQLQSISRAETPAAPDRAAEAVGDTRAAQQLSGTESENNMPFYSHEVQKLPPLWSSSTRSSISSSRRESLAPSPAGAQPSPTASRQTTQRVPRILAVGGTDENEGEGVSPVDGDDVRGGAGDRAGLAPIERSHTRVLPRTASSLRGSTVSNHVPHWVQSPFSQEECVTPLRRVLPVSTDAHHTASSAANASVSATSMLTPRSVFPPTPSTTSEQLPLQSGATVACVLPPPVQLATPSTTASAVAARVVHAARQTLHFARTSVHAQLRRSAKALEQCDQLTLSRLPYSAREALLATRARQAADEGVDFSRGTGNSSGSDSSARIVSPVSVAGSVMPAVDATAAVAVAILPPGKGQSEDDGAVSPASCLRSGAGASPPMLAFVSPHSRAVATEGTTVACPPPTIDAVSGEEKGARDSASEGSSVLGAVEGTQIGGDEEGERVIVVPVAMSTQASQRTRPNAAGDAVGNYTYNAAVEALVRARLAPRPNAVPQPQTKAPETAVVAAAVEESSPGSVEEALVAWRRMLQSIGSMLTTTTMAGDPGTDAGQLNAAADSSPSQTSCCLAATVVVPPHSITNGGVHPARHGIRCATDVVRGRETQRIVYEALCQASQHALPGDLVRPNRKTGPAACPKPALLDLPNVSLSGADGAEANAKTRGRAMRHTNGEMTLDVSLISGAAQLRRRPPQVSDGEDVVPWLPLSLGAAGLSISNAALAGPSTAAVTKVFQRLHRANCASAALLGIKDWTTVAPYLLTRSLPLSVRAVRIQRWWRQRHAAHLCRQRRAVLEAYLVEEERRDAAALRLQQQIRVHWAQEALARCAAACAACTEHRVAAEGTSTKHGNSVDSLTAASVAFDASNSLTRMPPPHGHLGRVVVHHPCKSSGGASLSKQLRHVNSIRIMSAPGRDSSLVGLRTLQVAAPAVAASDGVVNNTFLLFASTRAAVAPGDDDAGDSDRSPCEPACRSPLNVSTVSSLAAKAAEAIASLSVHNGTTSEQQNVAAHRIQRCYRHHLAHLHMVRLCRDVEVLSAVVTRRVPLSAIRLTLTAAPLSSSVAVPLMEQLPSDSVDGGAGELAVISSPSGGTCGSSHPLQYSSTTSWRAASVREAGNYSDVAMMCNLLGDYTGDVYEAYVQRGLAARRHGDYKTPLERVSLRDLQRIREEREVKAARQRQLYEREQQRKLEQQQRWERQALEASKTIQRTGRGCRWRCWLRKCEPRQCADPDEIEWLSRSTVSGLHNMELLSSKGLGAQPVMSPEEKQCAQLAGGEAVASHMISRLQAAHPQCFGIATSPTKAEYVASHCTPAQPCGSLQPLPPRLRQESSAGVAAAPGKAA